MEALTRTQEVDEMKEVVLTKDLGYLQIDNTGANPAIGPTSYNMGTWQELSANVFYMQEEIDVAGLTKMELTFFPTGGDVQRGGPVSVGLTNGYIVEWIYVTRTPHNPIVIQPDMTYNLVGQGTLGNEFENIIWGRTWTWALNTSLPQNFAVQVASSLMGSGEPTNGDRLYVYRIVTLIGATPATGFAEVPSCRLLLSGQLREEAEFQQLMRMRRSYELQQSYDED